MVAVVGFFVAAGIATAAALLTAGPHHVVRRDPTFELGDVASRQVPIVGALEGAMVLIGFLLLAVLGLA